MTWEILVINRRFVYSIIWFICKIGVIWNDYWKTIIYGFFQKITLFHAILYIFAWTVISNPLENETLQYTKIIGKTRVIFPGSFSWRWIFSSSQKNLAWIYPVGKVFWLFFVNVSRIMILSRLWSSLILKDDYRKEKMLQRRWQEHVEDPSFYQVKLFEFLF